jgi:hypothetical protein
MCGLCGAFGKEEHWSAGAGIKNATALDDRRGFRERIQQINSVLGYYHLSATSWHNVSYVIQSATGKQSVVNSLAGIWAEAEALCSENIDPLDPQLLKIIEGLSEAEK